MPSKCSEPPKSSLHALLREHRGGPDGITVHPKCENRWQSFLYARADRWWWSKDLDDKFVATQMPHSHKNGARWWVQQWEVDWGSHQHDFWSLSYTWCWDGIVAGMWTTFDGGCSIASSMSVWATEACDQCGWLSPFLECNVSIDEKLS
jgi:hypothetical protein